MHARRRRSTGQALVEFPLVLPILLLLVLGIVEFSRVWMVKQVITNAAREGARAGSAAGATTADVQATVTTYLDVAGLGQGYGLQMAGVGEMVDPGTTTWVEVSYDLETFSGGLIPGWEGTVAVEHRVTMRHE
jgi:Flp pilus assembly protein TadG